MPEGDQFAAAFRHPRTSLLPFAFRNFYCFQSTVQIWQSFCHIREFYESGQTFAAIIRREVHLTILGKVGFVQLTLGMQMREVDKGR